jgi:hypothetical protein
MPFVHGDTLHVLAVGDEVIDFRNNVETCLSFEPPTESFKSGYITTDAGRYYASVYGYKWEYAVQEN